MKSTQYSVLGAVAILLTCGYLVAGTPSKKPAKKRKPAPKAELHLPRESFIPTPEQLALLDGNSNDPARLYTIKPAPVGGDIKARTPEQERLFDLATAIMRRERPVPPDRVQFFKWVDEDNFHFKIKGWSTFVYHVTPIAGGLGITLKVWPKVTSDAIIANSYYEEYAWVNGIITYSKGYGNPKTPGKMVHW